MDENLTESIASPQFFISEIFARLGGGKLREKLREQGRCFVASNTDMVLARIQELLAQGHLDHVHDPSQRPAKYSRPPTWDHRACAQHNLH